MYYNSPPNLGALGISVKVKIPKTVNDFLKEFPKTQADVSRITSVAERLTDFIPVVLVGATALAAVFIILRARSAQ